MLLEVRPKALTRRTAWPGPGSAASPSTVRHRRRSSRFTRKSIGVTVWPGSGSAEGRGCAARRLARSGGREPGSNPEDAQDQVQEVVFGVYRDEPKNRLV